MEKNDGCAKETTWPDFSLWGSRTLSLDVKEKEDSSKDAELASGLYIVATPIGNLGDITLRALWTLQQTDLILCEDTRVSRKLLNAFGISKPLLSCHEHNEESREKEVLARLENGEAIALISDAGTPLIADPGYRLVCACREQGYRTMVIPGPSAVITGLAGAGLPTDRFLFVGFLPSKKAARRKELEALKVYSATLVFYESPHRIKATLSDMIEQFGPHHPAAIARELTKLYETHIKGTLQDLLTRYENGEIAKGEFVLMLGPCQAPQEETNWQEYLENLLKTMSLRDAVADTVATMGVAKKLVYTAALELSQKNSA